MSITADKSVGHYENFPVASFLIPQAQRAQIVTLYNFARTADDIADEGNDSNEIKLRTLSEFRISFLDKINKQNISKNIKDKWGIVTAPMAKLCQDGLPQEYPLRLLNAFSQDLEVLRYKNMEELLSYCHNSANPVGSSLLFFYNRHIPENIKLSNSICSALQLINFWQDIAIDWKKNRVYIPAEHLIKYGFRDDGVDSINLFAKGEKVSVNWQNLLSELIQHSRQLMLYGKSLPKIIGGRAGFELKLVIAGGLEILNKIEQVQGDVFNRRPKLGKKDWAKIITKAMFL